jgi:hypothetical protein
MKPCLRGTGGGRRGSQEAAAKPTLRRPRSAFSLAQKCFGDLLCKPEFAARQVADPQTVINGKSLGSQYAGSPVAAPFIGFGVQSVKSQYLGIGGQTQGIHPATEHHRGESRT